ncbi:homocysteine S-methyltransferase family protein [Botrimarina mediterranea]|uniref:Bifunctional homocysteine S-methyltransferase/5,10-methylenetetrahydrofolate reductase n=1 Tax=Botrimarina mediterranea TaxID=2528022 RepID=A0A518KDK3_9BACT|nr:homocysteine S-methyltransferase family protein [Botrimarina mediterranea]QDV75865.1 Bifunctional homocysteine S-methyltransferase/5,10-methylenetetrahydrofolate reductase [Botrimarina mediterranea]
MPRYRHALPQLAGQPILTDGGMETVLIFQEGIDLPCFASFPVLDSEEGRALLTRYLDQHLQIADGHGVGLLLESATWRASPDWVARVTGSPDPTAGINRAAIDFLAGYREQKSREITLPISGAVGPRGDGYIADSAMTADEAAEYHRTQIETLAATEADLVTAYTLNYVEEAIGVALAARGAGIPVAISLTVETDGRLPTGQPLDEAIQQVDEATGASPAYYMVNCAHPTHFAEVLDGSKPWTNRIHGLRANASTLSHAELEAMTELDDGDPDDLGRRVGSLRERLPHLSVLGGCCGTDHRHIAAIAAACFG